MCLLPSLDVVAVSQASSLKLNPNTKGAISVKQGITLATSLIKRAPVTVLTCILLIGGGGGGGGGAYLFSTSKIAHVQTLNKLGLQCHCDQVQFYHIYSISNSRF